MLLLNKMKSKRNSSRHTIAQGAGHLNKKKEYWQPDIFLDSIVLESVKASIQIIRIH